jgi:hypothetical protein
MTIDDFEVAAILMGYGSRHLEILLGRAVPLLIILRTDLDIETIRVEAEFGKLVHHDTAINASRKEDSDALRI